MHKIAKCEPADTTDPYYTDCQLKNPNNKYMTVKQIENFFRATTKTSMASTEYTTWQRLSDNKQCFSGPTNIHENQLIMSPPFYSSLPHFFAFLTVPGFFASVLFYSITLHICKLRKGTNSQEIFFCNKNPIPNQITSNNEWDCQWSPVLNSDPGNAIHTAVSHYQLMSWTDNQRKLDIPITRNQKTMCWACVNIFMFIFVLKVILIW